MLKKFFLYFKAGPDLPLISDENKVKKMFTSSRISVFLSITIGYSFYYVTRLSMSVSKKPMLDEGILSVEQMGVIGFFLLFTYGFGKFANGFLADFANIKKLMSFGLLMSAIINLLFGMTSNFYIFTALWAFNGWFQSMGNAPATVSLCQWYSNKERGTYWGIFSISHSIGEGITFVGTAVVMSYFGWRWGFLTPGLLCLPIAIALYFTMRDRPQAMGLPHVADFRKDYSAGKPTKKPVWEMQKEVLKNPHVWILGLSSAMMYVSRYAVNNWGVLYLQEIKGYELIDTAKVMAAYPFMAIVGAVVSGWVSDKFFGARRNVPTLIYGLINVICLTLFFLVPKGYIWLDIFAISMFGFAIGGLLVYLAGLIAVDISPIGAAGAVKGIIGLFSYIGAAIQDLISSVLIEAGKTTTAAGVDSYNFDYAFYFWIGAAVLSVLLALCVWHVEPKE